VCPSPSTQPAPGLKNKGKAKSWWSLWRDMNRSEKLAAALVAVPVLALAMAFGPVLALHLMLKRKNAQFCQGAPSEGNANANTSSPPLARPPPATSPAQTSPPEPPQKNLTSF